MQLSQQQHATRFASAAIREITEMAENVRRCLTQALGQDGKPLWEGVTPEIVRGGFTLEQRNELEKFVDTWADPVKRELTEEAARKRFTKTYGEGATKRAEPTFQRLPAGKKEAKKKDGK